MGFGIALQFSDVPSRRYGAVTKILQKSIFLPAHFLLGIFFRNAAGDLHLHGRIFHSCLQNVPWPGTGPRLRTSSKELLDGFGSTSSPAATAGRIRQLHENRRLFQAAVEGAPWTVWLAIISC